MPKPQTAPSEAWLLARYKRCGDRAAREELTRRMLPLIQQIARTYGSRAHRDDVEQVAALGLVKAIERYDPAYGVPLRSYAIPTMSGEVRRYLRDHSWSVHMPRRLQERVLAITKATARLSAATGRTPTADALATELDCTLDEVLEGQRAEAAYTAASLHASVGNSEDGERNVADMLGAEDERFQLAERAASLRALRDVLDDRERAVFYLRFVEDLTQTAVGERIGVSQMHVSRIVRRSLDRLRERLGSAA
jgi:RNA polymerase sigma-B factor